MYSSNESAGCSLRTNSGGTDSECASAENTDCSVYISEYSVYYADTGNTRYAS